MQLHRRAPHAARNGGKLHTAISDRRPAVFQFLIALQPCLLLCRSGTRTALYPFQLHAKDRLAFALAGILHIFPGCLQLQKSGIIRTVAVYLPFVDLHDPVYDTVQKIAVMRHEHDRPSILL